MPNMRNIHNRIKSVGSTSQITKAMNLVAASKLQKAKAKLLSARPFFNETKKTVANLVRNSKGIRHPYLVEKPVEKILIILITSDRGLCGGYNTNVSRQARNLIRGKTQGALIVVGTKGRDFFVRRKKTILRTITGISENPFIEDATNITREVLDLYDKGEYQKVYLVYTKFESTIKYTPKTFTLLPIDTAALEAGEESDKSKALMNYEPDEYSVLNYIIPRYVNTMIYSALVESAACQQAARMTGMDTATGNAEKVINKLTIQYNRARQSAITQELTEIVGGANALK